MNTSVFLGVRLQPNQNQKVKLDNIDLDGKVEMLREEAARKINVQKHTFGKLVISNCYF